MKAQQKDERMGGEGPAKGRKDGRGIPSKRTKGWEGKAQQKDERMGGEGPPRGRKDGRRRPTKRKKALRKSTVIVNQQQSQRGPKCRRHVTNDNAAPDSCSRLAAGCVKVLGAALLGFCVAPFGGAPVCPLQWFDSVFRCLPHPCWCGRPLDCLGRHRASCSLRCLGRRGCALESVAARVCREPGARVSTNVFLRWVWLASVQDQ